MSGRFNRHAGVNENNLTERYGNLEVIFGKKDLDEKTGNSSFCIITDDLAVSRTESAVFENLSMLSFGEKFWSTAYVFFR